MNLDYKIDKRRKKSFTRDNTMTWWVKSIQRGFKFLCLLPVLVSISVFASLVGVPFGTENSAVGLKFVH